MKLFQAILFLPILFLACQSKDSSTSKVEDATTFELPERPNILWLVTEDMGAYIPPFGDSTIVTPHLSKLAAEGVVYPNLYSTSGVCAPSRAAIVTGMYPSSIGANHMRTNSFTKERGLPAYEAVPPAEVKMISELLRKAGYYCTNNYKTDYQFKAPVTAWDESSPYAHWKNRGDGQPFFSVINFTTTHESGLFEPYGFREIETRHYHSGDRNYNWKNKGASHANNKSSESQTTVHISKDTKFKIPPYLVDNDVTQRDMWKLYNNIAEMDQQVGAVLKQLEEDGLLENTIIFFYGDHGGPLPREKRLIYDAGLNTPMIIRFPNKMKEGTKNNELISFVDFAPTLLSLIGEKPKSYMQGKAFLGSYKTDERKYIHAAADRFDTKTDVIRAVRDQRFKYIRNYKPDQGYYLPISYRERIPAMQELLRLRDEGKLNEIQKQWFRDTKPREELFDCKVDPFELNNLIDDPNYQSKLKELRGEMDRWLEAINDNPDLSEKELINKLWRNNSSQPVTAEPVINVNDNKVTLSCNTEGASIGYKVIYDQTNIPLQWNVYINPISLPEGARLKVQAHRIGYNPSKIIDFK
ncbi:sulfatase [Nonlabens arenilitoris]|uniref:Sulfatase n=1 Tax=Nonlabens arenilitoris TaxID=1217969 RepID=A0A2S7U836_9FLAO|nr:sulfatase-like hydrolase/transferase [Nonlabens arenilitoris]PQJ30721.1 sulfatase [Nonlabens arenilitoris]